MHIAIIQFQNIFPCNLTAVCLSVCIRYPNVRHLISISEYWAPFPYPIRHLIARSREVSKPEDWFFLFRMVQSPWTLTVTWAALLPMCLSYFKAMRQFKLPIPRLRDFMRSYDKASYCPVYGAFDLGLAVSVPLPIVTGIFLLLWFQSRLT